MWSKDLFSKTKTTMVLMGWFGGGFAEETFESVSKSKKNIEANEGGLIGLVLKQPPNPILGSVKYNECFWQAGVLLLLFFFFLAMGDSRTDSEAKWSVEENLNLSSNNT